ncbi:DUF488 domain-containing protein [Jiangella alba]|uniref:Uncharacterized conserved protein YeaO, DUF488 family n=1 Tax=Jiangella alba TaxID=561176 RepID=A0A1H5PKJ8_9ACTN|nr:DUF488 family protein [Jiangella alba]SEF13537.1 Uncharacterized conserved protein YeaO, DUF488 family [Jiangella alba]
MTTSVRIGRVYDEPDGRGRRVLVDRLWPRGVRRDDPRIDRWIPEVAPSTQLRRWYDHRPERYDEFAHRYELELADGSGAAALAEVAAFVAAGPTTLVTATREVQLSHLTVLARLLAEAP